MSDASGTVGLVMINDNYALWPSSQLYYGLFPL